MVTAKFEEDLSRFHIVPGSTRNVAIYRHHMQPPWCSAQSRSSREVLAELRIQRRALIFGELPELAASNT